MSQSVIQISINLDSETITLAGAREAFERRLIELVLLRGKGLAEAARYLRTNKNTLRSRVRKFNIKFTPGKGGRRRKEK